MNALQIGALIAAGFFVLSAIFGIKGLFNSFGGGRMSGESLSAIALFCYGGFIVSAAVTVFILLGRVGS